MTVTKIANGYLVQTEVLTYHANSLDEVLIRLKVCFGEIQAPEATFMFDELRKKEKK